MKYFNNSRNLFLFVLFTCFSASSFSAVNRYFNDYSFAIAAAQSALTPETFIRQQGAELSLVNNSTLEVVENYIIGPCPSGTAPNSSGECVSNSCKAGDPTSARVFVGWAICDDNSLACVTGPYVAPAQFSDGTCLADFVSQVPGSCSAAPGATVVVPLPIYCDLNGTMTGDPAGNEVNPLPGSSPGTGSGTGGGTGTGGTGSGTGGGGTPGNPCTVNCGTNPDGTPCTINCTPTPDPGTGSGTGGTGAGTGTSPTGTTGGSCGGPGQTPCALLAPDGMMNGITSEGDENPLKNRVTEATSLMEKWGSGDEPGKGFQNTFFNMWKDSFDVIPSSGCSSFSSRVGDYLWVFDPCPAAQKISDIAAYALWIYLFISTVILVTSKVE